MYAIMIRYFDLHMDALKQIHFFCRNVNFRPTS